MLPLRHCVPRLDNLDCLAYVEFQHQNNIQNEADGNKYGTVSEGESIMIQAESLHYGAEAVTDHQTHGMCAMEWEIFKSNLWTMYMTSVLNIHYVLFRMVYSFGAVPLITNKVFTGIQFITIKFLILFKLRS